MILSFSTYVSKHCLLYLIRQWFLSRYKILIGVIRVYSTVKYEELTVNGPDM